MAVRGIEEAAFRRQMQSYVTRHLGVSNAGGVGLRSGLTEWQFFVSLPDAVDRPFKTQTGAFYSPQNADLSFPVLRGFDVPYSTGPDFNP